MKSYCEARVWASGDTESCGKDSIIEVGGITLCQEHAKEKFEFLKKECVLLIDSAVGSCLNLSLLVSETDSINLEKEIQHFADIKSIILNSKAKEIIDPPVEDKKYWMKRAQEAEKQLKDLIKYGKYVFRENKLTEKINVCRYCKKECHGKVCDACISDAYEMLDRHEAPDNLSQLENSDCCYICKNKPATYDDMCLECAYERNPKIR